MDNNILKEYEADDKVKRWMEKIKECNDNASKWQKKADNASNKAKEYQNELEKYISSKRLEKTQAIEKNTQLLGITLDDLMSALERGDLTDLNIKIKENNKSSNDLDDPDSEVNENN